MNLQYKVGFMGAGNLAQAIIKGLVETKALPPDHIFVSNRSEGKLQKVTETYKVQAKATNEELVDSANVIVLAMKPQDLASAIDPIASSFQQDQIVMSLAAGVTIRSLEKKLPQCRIIRVMPNTPSLIGKGVIGYLASSKAQTLSTVVEDLFKPCGKVIECEDEDQFEALMIACSSGPGFIFELMTYWMEWIEERGFDHQLAREMTVQTFLGASMLASQSRESSIEDLIAKVASKKGVTAAGLESMREIEIERALRISFEKAALRNQELAKNT